MENWHTWWILSHVVGATISQHGHRVPISKPGTVQHTLYIRWTRLQHCVLLLHSEIVIHKDVQSPLSTGSIRELSKHKRDQLFSYLHIFCSIGVILHQLFRSRMKEDLRLHSYGGITTYLSCIILFLFYLSGCTAWTLIPLTEYYHQLCWLTYPQCKHCKCQVLCIYRILNGLGEP